MSDEIVLYDLKNKHNKCWSLNPWKTRLILNLKGLKYRTEWIEYVSKFFLIPIRMLTCLQISRSGAEFQGQVCKTHSN